MPHLGSPALSGFISLSASGDVQTKIPELPPDSKCCHSATSSKFVYCFWLRVTPTGLPVQWITPSFELHVSGAPLTGVKSFSVSSTQPGPVPSTKALDRAPESAGATAAGGSAANVM